MFNVQSKYSSMFKAQSKYSSKFKVQSSKYIDCLANIFRDSV